MAVTVRNSLRTQDLCSEYCVQKFAFRFVFHHIWKTISNLQMSIILTFLFTFKVYSIQMHYTGNTEFLKYVVLKTLEVSALTL